MDDLFIPESSLPYHFHLSSRHGHQCFDRFWDAFITRKMGREADRRGHSTSPDRPMDLIDQLRHENRRNNRRHMTNNYEGEYTTTPDNSVYFSPWQLYGGGGGGEIGPFVRSEENRPVEGSAYYLSQPDGPSTSVTFTEVPVPESSYSMTLGDTQQQVHREIELMARRITRLRNAGLSNRI